MRNTKEKNCKRCDVDRAIDYPYRLGLQSHMCVKYENGSKRTGQLLLDVIL